MPSSLRRLVSWRGGAGAVLAMVLALGLWAVFFASWMPAGAPDVEDDRACPGSDAELNKVLDRFALQLPPNATNVRFSSDVHALFGEYTVELRFSAPPTATLTTRWSTSWQWTRSDAASHDGAAASA